MRTPSFLALLFLILVGCSSSQKTTNSQELNREPSPRDAGLVEMSPTKPSTLESLPPVTIETKVNVEDKLDKKLQEAIIKQNDRAIAISAREILIREPQNISALNALALFHYRKGQIDLAKSLLNKAIASDSKVSLLYSNLAFIYQSTDDEEQAVQIYRQALQIDDSNAIAAANLGALYLRRKDYQKAKVAFDIAVNKGQRDWKTLSNYGVTLMALGLYPQADQQFKKAVELQSQNLQVQMNYAILLIEHMNKLTEGLAVLNRVRFMGPGPDLRKKISELEKRAKSVLK